ncbi:hypothetical protein ACWGH8_10110 [Nonomuraea muscovyensis]
MNPGSEYEPPNPPGPEPGRQYPPSPAWPATPPPNPGPHQPLGQGPHHAPGPQYPPGPGPQHPAGGPHQPSGPWPQHPPGSGPQYPAPPGQPPTAPPGQSPTGPPGRPPQGPPVQHPQGPPTMPPTVPSTMPPTMPPTMPQGLPAPGTPPPGRRGWVLPAVAVTIVLALAGAAGAYLVYGRTSTGEPGGTGASAKPPSSAPAAAVQGPDVCSLLSGATTDRLVPGATVAGTSRDTEYTVNFDCNWTNRRISFGEYWRSREIDVKVRQHKGQGAKTGRSMAQNSYEIDYGGAKFAETAKPTPTPGEKDYNSPPKDIPGVGDGAFAKYVWRRSGTVLWYSYGLAHARVGDMTIEVKYQASQQRKDAAVFTNKATQSVSEANAIREVSALVGEVSKGIAAWKAQHPGVLAQPRKAVTSSPSAQPTTSPQVIAFPPACKAVEPVATRLVPGPTPRARSSQAGGDVQTECRWLNLDVPAGDDVTKIRSVLITTHRFTNRAGAPDVGAAKGFYAKQRGGDKGMVGSELGGIVWGKVTDIKDLGQAAFDRYIEYRRMEVHNGSASVVVRQGSVVASVDYSGAERPKGVPADSGKVRLMPEKEARAGALEVARAYIAELAKQPGGG